MACVLMTMTLVFVAIAGRLVSIQAISADHYLAVGLSQRLRTVSLPGQRGSIFDRRGQELAVSVPQTTIWADPQLVSDPRQEAASLAPLLAIDSATVETKLRSAGEFVYLARRLDNAEAVRITDLRLPGVYSMPEPKRFLPAGALATPLLGSVGADNSGLSGLEQQYDQQLAGRPGKLIEERDPKGSQIPGGLRQYQAPVNGADLVLTIDEPLQVQTEQALASQIVAAKAKGGTAAVMDTQTGELLAVASMTSAPAASATATTTAVATAPAAPGATNVSCPPQIATKSATATTATPAAPAGAACQPVPSATALAFTGVFEPGSVSKLVTISAALQSGVVSPSDRFSVADSLQLSDALFRDAESHKVENWTVTDILANSSNVGTITIAQRLGKQRLDAALTAYGFGQQTPVRFPGESAGLVPDPAHWSDTSIGTIAIGQGVAVTAVQMLAAYNAIADGGVYVAPKLVAATVDTEGHTHPTPPSAEHRVVSPEVAQAMTTMLGEVVRVGTGQMAKIDGYTVAGKTGTARIPLQGARGYMNNVYTSSFAGFVPSEHPHLTGIIVLDQTSLFGGVAAAPLFSSLAGYGLREFHIAPLPAQAPVAGVPLATPATAQAAGETLSPKGAAPPAAVIGKTGNTGAAASPASGNRSSPSSPNRSSPSTTQVPASATAVARRAGPATTSTTSRPAKP